LRGPTVALGLQPLSRAAFVNPSEETEMNRDQVKGRAKEVAGKVKKNAGRAVGSPMTQARGLAKEVAGKIQKTVGDARNERNNSR
jgi:uncharacterized protein YjbJ (UPF0337 family)